MKKLKSILLVLLLVLLAPTVVKAGVLEGNETVNLNGSYDSTKLVFANNLNNDATIDGLALFAGNQLNTKGNVLIGAYAGNTVNISDNVSKDLYVAGNMITITKDAKINRDLFIAGNVVNLNSNVNRNIGVACSIANIGDITINGDATIYADTIVFNENTKINGTLTIREDANVTGLKESMYAKLVKEKHVDIDVKEITIKQRATDFLTSLVTAYVTMAVLLLVFKGIRGSLDKVKVEGKEVLHTSLKGLGVLAGVPVAAILAMVTVVLLPLGLIAIPIYIFMIYISSLIVAYIIGHLIWTKKQKSNLFIELLIGVLIVKVLSVIPIIGGLVIAVSLFYGMGIMACLVTNKPKTKK